MRQNRRRTGFTLVEMLCVIAIIVVLVAMLLPAIFGALGKAKQASNRNDISQLASMVQTFQSEFKVPYVPSRIRLSETWNYNLNLTATGQPVNQLDYDSYQYITRLWPRISTTTPMDWNGDGNTNGDFTLEGDQCLVFFLGGIPAGGNYAPGRSGNPGVLGFSTNPQNPTAAGGTRKGPFYEFQEGRLIDIHQATAASFYSYQDPYRNSVNAGQNIYGVYAYFSSYKQANGYNRYLPSLNMSDCNFLNVWPYAEDSSANPRYLNPSSFQIISAGADGMFGRGTDPTVGSPIWTPGLANTSPALNCAMMPNMRAGKDDMANFYDSLLGVSQ